MEQIIIGFSKAKGFAPFSRAIRFMLGQQFSHSYIKFYSDKYQRWMIYQASKSIVNFMSESVFLEHSVVIQEFTINISEEQKTELIKYAIDRAGRPYSLKAVFGFFLQELGITIPYLFKQKQAYVCSELVARALVDVLDWKITEDLDMISPSDLMDIVVEYLEDKEII